MAHPVLYVIYFTPKRKYRQSLWRHNKNLTLNKIFLILNNETASQFVKLETAFLMRIKSAIRLQRLYIKRQSLKYFGTPAECPRGYARNGIKGAAEKNG